MQQLANLNISRRLHSQKNMGKLVLLFFRLLNLLKRLLYQTPKFSTYNYGPLLVTFLICCYAHTLAKCLQIFAIKFAMRRLS